MAKVTRADSTAAVQYHLTRIYAKLGVSSRSEFAARYREAGVDASAAGKPRD